MSEQSMWGVVRKALKGMDPVRIENRCELGTPDVNIATGDWIELKIAELPKREETIVRVEHYTTEQRTWAIRRHHAGGRVWMLIKIRTSWLLIKGEVAAQYLGLVNFEKLKEVATATWQKKLNPSELQKILKKPLP